MGRVIEKSPALFPEKYPGGQITMSVPIEQARDYLPELRSVKNPKDHVVVHTLYLGAPDESGNHPVWYDDAYPYKQQWGDAATRDDYEATLQANGVPLPAENYQTEQEFWVASRRLHVEVFTSTESGREEEKKLLLTRRRGKHKRMSTVQSGEEMVSTLVENHGFDWYDVKSLVLPGNTKPGFSVTESLQATGSDVSERLIRVPEGYPRKIIRGVVFNPTRK